ncbi:synaptonemal complex central element protein 3 [Narcine bancroftii]|uniref:synaptonemal complex central element protein 3 n=1 Tax=Narcine bancroftii TaxID=1343680 RepID=UPI00383209C5
MAHGQERAFIHPQIPEAIEYTHDDVIKLLEDIHKELEEKLHELEMLSVQATCMTYDMVTIRTNPSVVDSMMRLNKAYLSCKESVGKEIEEFLSKPKED